MFTYQVFLGGTNFAGINMSGRINLKQKGIAWLDVHLPPRQLEEMTAAELNQLPTKSFPNVGIVFTEQNISRDEFLYWKWNIDQGQFIKLTGADLTEAETFRANARQMWIDRNAAFNDIKRQIVLENDWGNLTIQQKKVLVGAEMKDFTPNDWEALNLGDENYIGDYNYVYSIWLRLKRLLGF
jgi:hypothetical protein